MEELGYKPNEVTDDGMNLKIFIFIEIVCFINDCKSISNFCLVMFKVRRRAKQERVKENLSTSPSNPWQRSLTRSFQTFLWGSLKPVPGSFWEYALLIKDESL